MRSPGRMGALALAAGLAVNAGALGFACSFPDIGYAPIAGPTGTTSGGGSDTTTTTTSGGGAGGGGIPVGCDVDGDGMPSVACEGGTDCDDDNDGFAAISDACTGGNDCDDSEPLARPDQTDYFSVPRNGGGFDYNCDGTDEPEIEYYACSGLCSVKTNIFLQNQPCGQAAVFGDCESLFGSCNIVIQDNDKVRLCR